MDPPEEGLVVYKGPSSESSGMRRRSVKDQFDDRDQEGFDRPPSRGRRDANGGENNALALPSLAFDHCYVIIHR